MIPGHCLLGSPLRNVCGGKPVNHNQITSRRFSSCKQKLTLHSPLSAEIQHCSVRRLSQAVTAENSIFCYQHRSQTQLPQSQGEKSLLFLQAKRFTGNDLMLGGISLKAFNIYNYEANECLESCAESRHHQNSFWAFDGCWSIKRRNST